MKGTHAMTFVFAALAFYCAFTWVIAGVACNLSEEGKVPGLGETALDFFLIATFPVWGPAAAVADLFH